MSFDVKAQIAATILSGLLAAEGGDKEYSYSDQCSKPPGDEGWINQTGYSGQSMGHSRLDKDTGEVIWFEPVVIKTREQVMAEIAVKHMDALWEVLCSEAPRF